MLAILAIFFQGYLIQGGKNIVAFCSTLQNSTDCFKLEDLPDSKIQDRICIESQEKEESFI